MCDGVAPAIPDYNWTHATDGFVDKDGFAIVIVQVHWSSKELWSSG